jgi:hypothetical protein
MAEAPQFHSLKPYGGVKAMTNLSRLVLFLGVASFAPACGNKLTLEDLAEFPNFTVTLRNSTADGQFIHIFGPDETNDILNRLLPSQTRPYLVENHDCAGPCTIIFTAGRNFGLPTQVTVTGRCRWSGVPSNAEVVWNGTALSCVGANWTTI